MTLLDRRTFVKTILATTASGPPACARLYSAVRLPKMPNSFSPHLPMCSTGWVLFDKTDPTKVLARADHPIFWPQQEWEKVGQVPNVVFVEGLVRDGNHWLFYYGGADKHIGLASAPVS